MKQYVIVFLILDSWSVEIDNAMIWRAGNWAVLDTKLSKKILRVHYDQLFIISNNKVLESINIGSKLKGFFKENVLILIIGAASQEVIIFNNYY